HGGKDADTHPFGAVIAPVHHSSTYGFATFAELRAYARGELNREDYFYSRYANPTIAAVERKLAALEGGAAALVTSSGMAATFCALAALAAAGDEILAADSIYGGTTKLLRDGFARFGVTVRFISLDDLLRLPEIATEKTRAVWFETPTNPINRVVDLRAVAASAQAAKIFTVVDNTFATPVLQQPLAHGIDAVMHSATKYLGGHSDLTAGALVGADEFIARARAAAIMVGTTLDPAAAYLLDRGIKTLEVRVRAACANAQSVAEFLATRAEVGRVYYPGLLTDENHTLAAAQMQSGCGAIVAFDIRGGEAAAEKFFDNLQLIRSAPSLGGVESLASYPLYSSHAGYTEEQLRAAGVSAATIRLAIG
ncbi:MAG: trans-sulfuration enzyme family protein, partial [Pseudonocardiaceae bacterium]